MHFPSSKQGCGHRLAYLALAVSSAVASLTAPELLAHHGRLAGLLSRAAPAPKTFKLLYNWSGPTFFDNWDFFNYPDPTHGTVNYLDAASAMSRHAPLAYINAAGNAVIAVDSRTVLPAGANRNSVRITSKVPFQKGQLLILDARHIPTGCSTWPAFWTVGPNWPSGGEIDIIEGTNVGTLNQYTLHTNNGCSTKIPMKATSTVLLTDCSVYASDNNLGCSNQDQNPKSFGPGFNNANGGVYATLWDDSGITIWHFANNAIPWDVRRARPVPSSWGKPQSFWSEETCDTSEHFSANQTVVINTTLCGDWADAVFSQSCPGTCSEYIQNPRHFKEAYWEISSVRIYS